jgi:hypothetical protein
MEKEEWLEKYGFHLDGAPNWEEVDENHYPVCLVDNGPFTAAAIAYRSEELEVFSESTLDRRPKTWYTVEKRHLQQFLER